MGSPRSGAMYSSTHWAERAREARHLAQLIEDDDARTAMLRVAGDYERLSRKMPAEQVDTRRPRAGGDPGAEPHPRRYDLSPR